MKESILSTITRAWKWVINRDNCNDKKFNGTITVKVPNMQYFGIVDWKKTYGVSFTPKQIMAIGDFPWSDELLNSPCPFNPGKTIRETHFAFVGLDTITIMELQRLNPKETEPRFYVYAPDVWYTREEFARRSMKFRWYLLLREIIPDSECKTFNKQKMLLPKEYEIPTAVVETAKDFLIYKKEEIYVNDARYARTADKNSGSYRVVVGCCDTEGVFVRFRENKEPKDNVGIAASRRLP